MTETKSRKPWQNEKIGIHCDIGEAFGNWTMGDDEAIMPYLSSASIACGFHAGDPDVMAKTVKLAKKNGVKIGAHPSYHDLQGFGRRVISMGSEEITNMVLYQIGALKAFLDIENITLNHVSPHGSLYGEMCHNYDVCLAVTKAVAYYPNVPIIGAAGTLMESVAKELNVPFIQEVIGDLDYNDEGDCIITRVHEACNTKNFKSKIEQVVLEGTVTSITGKNVDLKLSDVPLSFCIHSDTPNAHENALLTRQIVDDLNSKLGFGM